MRALLVASLVFLVSGCSGSESGNARVLAEPPPSPDESGFVDQNVSVAAGSAEFCESAEAVGNSDANFAGDFGEMGKLSERMADRLPDDAPSELREVLDVIGDLAEMVDERGGLADLSTLTDDEQRVIFEADLVLSRIDGYGLDQWVIAKCPGADLTRLLTGGGFGMTASSSASSTQPVSATATPSPTATPTPTPIPVVTEAINTDGPKATFRARLMEMTGAWQTNGTVDSFFEKEDLASERQRLFIKMFAQTTDAGARMFARDFVLVSPDGRRTASDNVYNTIGNRGDRIDLEAQDSRDFLVDFELPEPVVGFDGWHVLYGGTDVVNVAFPFSGTIPERYPIALEVPTTPYVYNHDGKDDPCSDRMTLSAKGAAVTLEGSDWREKLDRAPTNSRYVAIDIEVANDPGPLDDECTRGQWISGLHDFRIIADGQPKKVAHSRQSVSIDRDETVPLSMRFEIPAEASVLELVDETGRVALRWEVDIPPVFGEEGFDPAAAYAGPTLVGGDAVG